MALTINNVTYNWSMVQLVCPALTGSSDPNPTILQGVSAIKYNVSRKVSKNYGLGGNLVSRGLGNRECTASITMDYATQKQLRNGARGLIELGEFDLIVSFANPQINGVDAFAGESIPAGNWDTEIVTLKGCFFNEDGLESQTDDDVITKEFDLNPFDIEIGA